MTEKYTSGPYIVMAAAGDVRVWGGDGMFVCHCGFKSDPRAVPNAERIRLALTCHDGLLAACEAAEDVLYRTPGGHGMVLDNVRAAIALAKGGAK